MMITPKLQDIKHKNQLLRLLRAILKNELLANCLQFKGGTYAALRGVLDRFSVDLDFDLPTDKHDLPNQAKKNAIRQKCYQIFDQLQLSVKDESSSHLQFFLQYTAKSNERNTLKLEVNDQPSSHNQYEKVRLRELNMYCQGHTLETMFANKLVAATARFDKTRKIAGRDFYDLHQFFLQGLAINQAVVEDKTGLNLTDYLQKLIGFINQKLTQKSLNQDLNPLLPPEQIRQILPVLKPELLVFIQDEIKRQN
ncbi:nucleotidyl transferase AbiEii/AbiGii toxin family protein [Patescibacteria group bacterium]|nr:nucleotidyl transferase AbiEii/AbiGii toxin family protein [Patescibacteria group bacterium]MBU1967271.1 nucleotidyl transferase AbiEii/AbiGii toxin family protein [Patescibacteria group bacterium]MBU2543547.1 nucleotidyl transferase AbiEii/AbiGii toxin family protein [Patescibacteria group bacterium]